ncbi:hypothetical protein LSAT2_019637 [Lamellibrachia satsuma]|nr:hypothetical protein LSAT2_019637 [Lamellibrachia satsuma]
MEDRTYRVQIDSTTSEHIPLQCGVPQGSVLGPVMFTLCATPMQLIFRRYGVHYHKYVDDIQLYASYNPAVPGEQPETVRRLTDCIREVRRKHFCDDNFANKLKFDMGYAKSLVLKETAIPTIYPTVTTNASSGKQNATPTIRNRRTFNTDEASIPMMMRRVCQEELLRDSFVEILGIVKLTDTVLLLMTAVDVDLEGLIKTDWWCNITYGEPVDKVRLISGQVLQALEWMHKQGFGHLDIKPGNVGFNIDHKQVVIFDFGTARKFADGDVCTKQGMTRCYMAPELWQGVLNKKADVFAVGCLAYFLFHGKHMWWDEMMGSKTYLKELTIQHVYQKFQRIRYDTLRDLLISMCLPDTRMRLSAAEAHAFLRQLDIKDLPPAPTLREPHNYGQSQPSCYDPLHGADRPTAPPSDLKSPPTMSIAIRSYHLGRWAEAELPHLTEFMPGDDQEKSLLEGDQDRPMDRRTSNTDGLSVAGQIPALSQLLSSDDVMPPQSVEGNQEEQALAGKDPQMHTSMQTSGFVTMDPNPERLDDEQHDAG